MEPPIKPPPDDRSAAASTRLLQHRLSETRISLRESWQAVLRKVLPRRALGLEADPAPLNVGAAAVRTVSRSLWGMFVPAVLPIAGYGTYSLLQTTAAVMSQIGILGTPQTLLRQPRRKFPIAGLFLHSVLIACLLLPLLLLRGGVTDGSYDLLVVAMAVTLIGYGIVVARAKSANAFAAVFRAEAIGGLALLAALGGLLLLGRRGGGRGASYATVATLEILVTLVVVLVLVVPPSTRITRQELRVAGARVLLPSVYSVGLLVLLDLVIFRRLEMYFLEASPDGLQGVAVFGLGAQLAGLFLLFPAAILEAWMPGLATSFAGAWSAFDAHFASNRRAYRRAFALVVAGSILGPPLLVRMLFTRYMPWVWYIGAFTAIRVVCGYAGLYSSALYVTRGERWLYLPGLLGAVVGIGSNWLFTIPWGIRGAVAAFALTQGTVAVATLVAFRAAIPSMRREAGGGTAGVAQGASG